MALPGISHRGITLRSSNVRMVVRRATVVALIVIVLAIVYSVSQGLRPLIVYSGSMEPTIPTGSVVVVKPTSPENLYVGDVITVNRPGGLGIVTHRIQSMQVVDGRNVFQTKGDANDFPDPQLFTLEHQAGRVVGRVPYLGYAMVYASSPLIRMALVAVSVYSVLMVSSKRRARPSALGPGEGGRHA